MADIRNWLSKMMDSTHTANLVRDESGNIVGLNPPSEDEIEALMSVITGSFYPAGKLPHIYGGKAARSLTGARGAAKRGLPADPREVGLSPEQIKNLRLAEKYGPR